MDEEQPTVLNEELTPQQIDVSSLERQEIQLKDPVIASVDVQTEIKENIEATSQAIQINTTREKIFKFFNFIFPILAILTAHVMFGLLPIFSRGITTSPTGIPIFISLFLSYLVMFIFYIPRGIYSIIKMPDKKTTVLNFLKNWLVYVFTMSQILVVVFKFIGTKFTTATIVQLILQLTPFVVVVLSFVFMKEKIHFLTIICMIFSVIGGVLVMISTPNKHDSNYTFYFTINFQSFVNNFKLLDLVGIGSALICMIALATFIVIVNYSKVSNKPVSNEALYFVTSISGVFLFILLSLILQENWMMLFKATLFDYLLLLGYTFAQFFGIILDLYSIPKIGASKASSILSLRLITTVIVSWPLLNEEMNNLWQFIGCVLVITGVTTFILHKIHLERKI